MAFGKNEQPTTSSPPPQVISPTSSSQETPTVKQEVTQSQVVATSNVTEEIKAPIGVTPGVPLSQLKTEVEQQQSKEDVATLQTDDPARGFGVGLVAAQFIALFVILVGFIPPLLWQNTFLQVSGMLLIGLALFIGIWAVLSFRQKISILPTPGENSFLVTGGPFAYIRHPLYFSLLVGSFGLTIAYPTIPRVIALVCLALILHVKVKYEEKMLAKRFNGYEKYRQNTGALFPKIKSKKAPQLAEPPQSPDNDTTQ